MILWKYFLKGIGIKYLRSNRHALLHRTLSWAIMNEYELRHHQHFDQIVSRCLDCRQSVWYYHGPIWTPDAKDWMLKLVNRFEVYKQGSLDLWVLHCHKCQLLVNTKIPAHLGDSWKSPQWHSLAREAPENSYRKSHLLSHDRNIGIVLLLTNRCFHCPVEMHHRESKSSPANFHLHLTSPEYKHSNANSLLNRYFSVLSDLCESKRHVLCCNPEHLLWIFPTVEVAATKILIRTISVHKKKRNKYLKSKLTNWRLCIRNAFETVKRSMVRQFLFNATN